jgi:hypothetical protein
MRLTIELLLVAAIIYLGWDKPYRDWLRTSESSGAATPAITETPDQQITPIARSASTPSGEWMWDPAHHSTLDRPAYDSREPSKRYMDAQGRTYWYDATGIRHYDP